MPRLGRQGQAAAEFRFRPLQKSGQVILRQPLKNKHLRTGQQCRVKLERRVLRRRADK
jgi:hypothetical protein